MNSFTKKVAKAAVSTVVLGGLLLTTACANDSRPATSAPSSPAANHTPAGPVEPAPAPAVDGSKLIMGVDVNKAIAENVDAGVSKTFPNETKESLTEGVTFALTTYQGLVNVQNFYRARTTSDNTLLVPDTEKFDKTYFDAMTARTNSNNGKIQDILSFGQNGEIGKDDAGVEHYIKDGATVQFVSGQPNVEAGGTPSNGNVIVIKGTATLTVPTSDNKVATATPDYWISITPTGNGTWLVSGMGFKTKSNTTYTDSVPAPKAPNGN